MISVGFYSRARLSYIRDSGWEESLVHQSYQWVEDSMVFRPALKQWQRTFRNGLLQAGAYPYNGYIFYHIEGTKVGGTTFDSRGLCHYSIDLLEHAKFNNLRVAIRAKVSQIFFS
jgi:choline dehydrogenase